MPPVTAERSPPDSRITGADSPVIADSSTLAMPSTTSPSPGMTWPATTTTVSPGCRSRAGHLPCRRRRSGDRRLPRVAQRRRLRLAAALGDGLGEVGEQDGQPQPDRRSASRTAWGRRSPARWRRPSRPRRRRSPGWRSRPAGRACARASRRAGPHLLGSEQVPARTPRGVRTGCGHVLQPFCERSQRERREVGEADDDEDDGGRAARRTAGGGSGRCRRWPAAAPARRADRRAPARTRSAGTGRRPSPGRARCCRRACSPRARRTPSRCCCRPR